MTILILLLKKVRDQYGTRKYIQMEALPARYYFINSLLVPADNLSLCDLVEMMEDVLLLLYIKIILYAHQYGPELNERIRKHLKSTNDFWRVDETYIKIKREKMHLYRAIDSEGNTIDFYLSRKRDTKTAKCFLKKVFASGHATRPRSIAADGDKAYPVAMRELKKEKCIPLRVKKYLNNIIEQDYSCIKKRILNMLGVKSLQTVTKMNAGLEAMHMIKMETCCK